MEIVQERDHAGCGADEVGNFDVLHLGHQRILATARNLRRQHPGSILAVVTFEPHPLTVLRPQSVPPRLSPLPLKQSLLADAGVDVLVILPPSHDVLDLPAEEFWRILRDQTRARHVVEGSSFTFGKARRGTIDLLGQWAQNSPVTLHVMPTLEMPLLDCRIVPVNSSAIRWLLGYGRVRDAAICLGRPYALHGQVVLGQQRGRTLGIPTANLNITDQLIPADGVYAARCTLANQTYAVAFSIGSNPTFGPNPLQVEAHLIGFTGDLYGQTLRIDLLDWLREQRRYADVDQLKSQLALDLSAAASRVDMDPARPIAQSA